MTPDTDALLATVRESGLYAHSEAALDSLAAELERVKAERDENWEGYVAHRELWEADKAGLDKALTALRETHNEVDCRIEHGAESGGHLEYVRERLARNIAEIEGEAPVPGTGQVGC